MSEKQQTKVVKAWLESLESALEANDTEAAVQLFGEDSYWRDLVALTWNIKTSEGRDDIAAMLKATLGHAKPSNFQIAGEANEADGVIDAWFTFETATGRGSITFDRTVALAQIAVPSEDQTIINELSVYEVAAIRRLRSNRHRITRGMEREAFERRYVVAQPNLDESSWRVHGQLPATAGRTLVEALDHKADQLPPGGGGSRTTRWADALWAMSLDSLAGGDGATIETSTPLLTVFVDANDAAATNGASSTEENLVSSANPKHAPSPTHSCLDGIVSRSSRRKTSNEVAVLSGIARVSLPTYWNR